MAQYSRLFLHFLHALTDAQKRAAYDRYGHAGVSGAGSSCALSLLAGKMTKTNWKKYFCIFIIFTFNGAGGKIPWSW